MSNIWISLKRDKIYADIFHKGIKICTIRVNEANRSNTSIISLEADSEVTYKIVKQLKGFDIVDEDIYNKECYNK